jgi:hypothetical protein
MVNGILYRLFFVFVVDDETEVGKIKACFGLIDHTLSDHS